MSDSKTYVLASSCPYQTRTSSRVNVVFDVHDTLNLTHVWFLLTEFKADLNHVVQSIGIHRFFVGHTEAKVVVERQGVDGADFVDVRQGGRYFSYSITDEEKATENPDFFCSSYTKGTARELWDVIMKDPRWHLVSNPDELHQYRSMMKFIRDPRHDELKKVVLRNPVIHSGKADNYALQA